MSSEISISDAPTDPRIKKVGVVLLAGGKGKRMKSTVPKQFLPLLGKPVFLRSLDIFRSMEGVVSDIVIVLDESYRAEFNYILREDPRICWADPGNERQDSVFNGLHAIPDTCSIVAIHDAARPLVTVKEILNVLKDGLLHGAAVLGVPMKATVKESEDGQFVLRTVERSRLWEIHTPQVASKSLFLEGFAKVKAENLEVTDDVSVIEALGKPVKLTLGEYTNIKLTTPDDLQVAEQVLRERGVEVVAAAALVEEAQIAVVEEVTAAALVEEAQIAIVEEVAAAALVEEAQIAVVEEVKAAVVKEAQIAAAVVSRKIYF